MEGYRSCKSRRPLLKKALLERPSKRLLNRMVKYPNLRPSRYVENPFSDWQQLGAVILLLHALAFSTANGQSQSTASPIRAEAKTQSTQAAEANQAQNPPLFSFSYTIDSAKPVAFGGSAQPLPDDTNIALIGGLSDDRNAGRRPV
jgi:hypothetical protein